MSQKTFSFLTGITFVGIIIIHLVLFLQNQTVSVFGWLLPVRAHWLVILYAVFFAYYGLKLSRKP
ncbi:MAG: hypothetical protein COX36_01940 [Candidatus Nealsonbacteria bacterium CG23_combo_of_CG06-09_8_20_14_all_38_19]|uniref:Uncharacterized protein n=1 Tax=Candidatus Nealsonbacteria bacterium CG23_combo_of_CG06-09_8_20_14_all_38_19 TaxID=1974721 RepID=A0A2G9YWT4_9BACT|nr:MAG: hypothetical protein COX36_01940 [Candidatus Nealsonbacteria bacterium CG23_combo_of_CG06-09_8_20_14_all_38_19]